MSMSVGTYYAKYILGNENFAGFLMAISIVPVVIFMPLLPPLIRKIGKCKVSIIGGIISVVALSLMALNPTSMNWLLVCSLIKGIGQSATAGTIFAMVADTIEYGQLVFVQKECYIQVQHLVQKLVWELVVQLLWLF